MKKYFAINKFKLAYTFLILAFLVAACNYPVTQQESLGEVLSWEAPGESSDMATRIEALEFVKTSDYTVNIKEVNGKPVLFYNLVLKNASPESVAEFKKQLQSIQGVTNLTVVPINETVTRPVYSAALNEIFKININATNMSDEDLKNEITGQLKNEGIDNMQIDFERDENGHRMIKFSRPLNENPDNGGFDVTITDGNNINHMKEIRKTGEAHADRFKGKSDAEIKKIVKEDHKDVNLTDDQIEIIREGDNVKIKVNVKKVNGNTNEELDIEKEEK